MIKKSLAVLLIPVIMLTACSKIEKSERTKNVLNMLEENDLQEKDNAIYSAADLSEGYAEEEIWEHLSTVYYGKVKNIIGNEIEIVIGEPPEQNWEEKFDSEEKKKSQVPMVKISEKENLPGFEDFYVPEYLGSTFGEDGEIHFTYTGERRTLIIHAGTDIRDRFNKKETLNAIKKGTVLMVTPKIIDSKDMGVEILRILKY